MSDSPLVSIIIPTHNRERIIAATVRSALAQTYPNKEVIVVDDGSSDQTAAVIAQFPEVNFHRKAQGGPASARNLALREARGSLVAMLDSDDEWDAGHLTGAVAGLETTGAGVICMSFRGQRGDGSLSYANYYQECRPHLPHYLTDRRGDYLVVDPVRARELLLAHSEAPSSATVFRREVMGSGWDDRLFGTEDHLILVQAVMDHGCSIAFSLAPSWTKKTDTENIYDGSRARARHARMNVLTRKVIVERWGKELSVREVAELRRLNAVEYADWAVHESSKGRKLAAIGRYLESALLDWTVVAERWSRR